MQLLASARKTGAKNLLVSPSQPLERVIPADGKRAQQPKSGEPLLSASTWQPACSPGPAEAQPCFTKVKTLALVNMGNVSVVAVVRVIERSGF